MTTTDLTTTVETLNPQEIFWKTSDVDVPKAFAQRLIDLFGTDRFGDANVRVRFDSKRFLEGCWVVEEKWEPEAFGNKREWQKTQIFQDELGIRHDFGDFPSRGIYASVLVWCDAEGRTLPLNDDLIDRLCYQKHARETKNIQFAEVVGQTAEKEAYVEYQQKIRQEEAIKQLAEELKKDKEKIIAAATRQMSIPKEIISVNQTKSENP